MAAKPLHITPHVRYVSEDVSFGPSGQQWRTASAHIDFADADGTEIALPAMDDHGICFGCTTIVVTLPEGGMAHVSHHDADRKVHRLSGDQSRWIAMARDAIAQHLGRQAVAS